MGLRIVSWVLLIASACLVAFLVRQLIFETADLVPGLFFTRTRAVYAALIFLGSILFFSLFFLSSAIFNGPNKNATLGKWVKGFDLAWYPLGVAAAILALAGSDFAQLDRVILENKQRKERARDLLNLNFPPLHKHCDYFVQGGLERSLEFLFYSFQADESERISAHIAVMPTFKKMTERKRKSSIHSLVIPPDGRVKTSELISFCEDARLGTKEFQTLPYFLSGNYSKRGFDLAVRDRFFDQCSSLFNAQANLLRFPSVWAPSYSLRQGKVERTENPHFEGIKNFCEDAMALESARLFVAFFERAKENRFLIALNPWSWMIIVAFFAGLKLTKSIIELYLLRTTPKAHAASGYTGRTDKHSTRRTKLDRAHKRSKRKPGRH
jgi:hypothetical protein